MRGVQVYQMHTYVNFESLKFLVSPLLRRVFAATHLASVSHIWQLLISERKKFKKMCGELVVLELSYNFGSANISPTINRYITQYLNSERSIESVSDAHYGIHIQIFRS